MGNLIPVLPRRWENQVFQRWPNGTVPFNFDASITAPTRANVLAGINELQTRTLFRFVPRTTQRDFLRFRERAGDFSRSSWIGRQGGRQWITLLPGTGTDTVMHEIGHALGLIHEHQRRDRNDFVRIHRRNVAPGWLLDVVPTIPGSIPWGDYDFDSIMHYSATGGGRDLRYDWISPWTDIVFHSHPAGGGFALLFNADSGRFERRQVDAVGRIGERFQDGRFTARWTHVDHYAANGRLFELRFRAGDGRQAIREILPDGMPARQDSDRRRFGGGPWARPGLMAAFGTYNLLLLDRGARRLHLHRLTGFGALQEIDADEQRIANDFTDVYFQQIDNTHRWLLFNAERPRRRPHASVFAVLPDAIGDFVGNPDWRGNCQQPQFHRVDATTTFLLGYQRGRGRLQQFNLATDGSLSAPTQQTAVAAQRDLVRLYDTSTGALRLLEVSNGQRGSRGRSRQASSVTLTVGDRLRSTAPTIERLNSDDQSFGRATTLSSTDIAAINQLCEAPLQIQDLDGEGRPGDRREIERPGRRFTHAVGLRSNRTHWLFRGRAGTTAAELVRLDADGHLSDLVVLSPDLPSWSQTSVAGIGSSRFLYLMQGGSRRLWRNRLSATGFAREVVDTGVDLDGIGPVSFLEAVPFGDSALLAAYSRRSGQLRCVPLAADGSPDAEAGGGSNPGADCVSGCAYVRGRRSHLVLLDPRRPPIFLRATPDGRALQPLEGVPPLGRGWSHAAWAQAGNRLILYNQANGRMTSWFIGANGRPARGTDKRLVAERPGWTLLRVLPVRNGQRLLFVRPPGT